MKSHDVKVWSIRKRPYKTPSYDVRWKVAAAPPFSETFRTKALADNFRAKLLRAAQKGRPSTRIPGCRTPWRRSKNPSPGTTSDGPMWP